jgi:hypothetical protein
MVGVTWQPPTHSRAATGGGARLKGEDSSRTVDTYTERTFGDLRITAYSESSACDVEGIGPRPFR